MPSAQIGPDRTDFVLLPARPCGHVKEEKKECARPGASLRGKRSAGFADPYGGQLLVSPAPRAEGPAGQEVQDPGEKNPQ